MFYGYKNYLSLIYNIVMSENKIFTCDQIIHIINEVQEDIWENDSIDADIDFSTMRYIMHRMKSIFINAMAGERTPERSSD